MGVFASVVLKLVCFRRGLESLPAVNTTVARFLIFLTESSCSVSGALMARSAITYFHKLVNTEATPPSDNFLVRRVMRSLREKFAKPVKKAVPFTSELLKQFVDYVGDQPSSFEILRLLAFISLSFMIFGRYSDLSNLKV